MKKNTDVFYTRNLISLIHVISIIKQSKSKNYKLLFINYQWIDKKILTFFRKFLMNYFDEIITFKFTTNEFYRTSDDNKLTFVSNVSYSSRFKLKTYNLNKLIKKINFDFEKYDVKNLYSGGDDFHLLFKKSTKIFYVEHGIGNYRDGILYKKKIIFSLINQLLIFVNLFGANFYSFKKYDGYCSLLSNRFKSKLILNNYETNFVQTKNKYFLDVLKEISKYVKKNYKNKYINSPKNITFLNLMGLKYVNAKISNKLVQNIVSKVKKNEIVYLKNHPTYVSGNDPIKIKLIREFKRKKVKFTEIKDVFLTTLPLELLIFLTGSKKLISSFSSTPLFCSILYKNKMFKNLLLFDYSMRYPYDDEAKRNTKISRLITQKFQNIDLI